MLGTLLILYAYQGKTTLSQDSILVKLYLNYV